jgi:hypothetical protein
LCSLACLALAIGFMVTTASTASDQLVAVEPGAVVAPDDLVGGLCPADPTCPGQGPKASICHYDKGKPEGHINCQNASSIVSHIGPSGHDRDYCAADTGNVCINIAPSPEPTPTPVPQP